jgi:ArsR family transcriptional regulator
MPSGANDKLGLKVELLKAMGHPVRLSIIELLENGELSVREIEANLGIDASAVSKHLSVLNKAGIVELRREGPRMMYRIVMPCALDITRLLEREAYERLKERRAATVV